MLHSTIFKYLIFCVGVMAVIVIAVPFANGEIFSRETDRSLRIVYSGGLKGTIEPCG